jgi:tetratricopeptide (TPR) repeat protein
MRKINLKLLLWLMAGTGVVVAAGFAVHYFQSRRIAAALLWQADRAREQVPYAAEREVRYLQRYLEFQPRDELQLARLARILGGDEYAGNIKARRRALAILRDHLPLENNLELSRLLVRVALELGANPDNCNTARRTLDRLGIKNDTTTPPQGMEEAVFGELKGRQGWLFELEKNKEEAVAAYDLALQFSPHEIDNYQRLAWLLRDATRESNRGDPEQRAQNSKRADQIIDAMVKHNAEGKEAANAYLGRWRYRRAFGLIDVRNDGKSGKIDLKEAMNDVTMARQRDPDSADVLLADADVQRLLEGQVRDDRRQDYRKQGKAILARALALQRKPGYRGATESNYYQILWQLTNLKLDDLYDDTVENVGKSDLTVAIQNQIVDLRKVRSAQQALTEFLDARLLLYEQKWAEARDKFTKARTELAVRYVDVTGQIDLSLARCYEQLEDYVQSFAAYKRVLDWDPSSVVARLGMASARWSEGRLDEAAQSFQEVALMGKMPDRVWLDFARLEVQRQALKADPAKRDWNVAEQALDNAKKAAPSLAAQVELLRADIRMGKGESKTAEDDLRAALASDIEKKEFIYAALIELYRRGKSRAKAEALLNEAETKLGTKTELRLARGRLLVDGKGKQVIAALNALQEGYDKLTPEEQSRLLGGLAELHFLAGDTKGAWKLCLDLAAMPQHQSDLKLRLMLFDLTMKLSDEGGDIGDREIDSSLERIAALERDQGLFHPYAQALRLIHKARKAKSMAERNAALDEAMRQLSRISAARAASWAPLFRARAEIYKMRGSTDKVITELKLALENNDNSPAVIKDLALAYDSAGLTQEADDLIQQQQSMLKQDKQLAQIGALLAVRRGDAARAIDLARINAPEDGKATSDDLRWKSLMLRLAKPNDKAALTEAEKTLHEAIDKDPTQPESYIALVGFLMSQRRTDDADAILKQALAKIGPEMLELTKGQCYEIMGRIKEAAEAFTAAAEKHREKARVVKIAATFFVRAGQLANAEKWLRLLVDQRVKDATADDTAWARRGLAMVLSSSTDYRRFREAMELVGLPLDDRGRLPREIKSDENNENQRARARVLATQPQKRYRTLAIEIFEAMGGNGGINTEDSYLLALLYDTTGQGAKSRSLLKEIVTKLSGMANARLQPQTSLYMAQLIQGLIRNKELKEAAVWLDRLEGIEKERNLPKGTLATVELRARLLEEQGERDQALDLLRTYAEREKALPTDRLLLVSAMARQKRFHEALDEWKKVARTCPPEVAGGLSVALLRSMKPRDEEVLEVETWLRKTATKHPDTVVLHIHLADMYDLRGRYAEAEAEYRKVLDREPGNVVALNNLAWLLGHRKDEAARALPLIDDAVRGQGRRADLLDTRAVILLALGKTDAALSDLKEAVEADATPTRLFHLAQALHQSRDRDRTLQQLREAKALGLTPALLHPVEQQVCRELLAEYGVE